MIKKSLCLVNSPDLLVINPKVFKDSRGYFMESFNRNLFHEDIEFVQDNESCSCKGTVRGLHYQRDEFAQAKLVRVISGAVYDVVLDLRENYESYGQISIVYLSGKNKRQFFIPRGFAHGFITLEDNTIFSYKCDNYYSKEHESGFSFNSPKVIEFLKTLNVLPKQVIMSKKDLDWTNFY